MTEAPPGVSPPPDPVRLARLKSVSPYWWVVGLAMITFGAGSCIDRMVMDRRVEDQASRYERDRDRLVADAKRERDRVIDDLRQQLADERAAARFNAGAVEDLKRRLGDAQATSRSGSDEVSALRRAERERDRLVEDLKMQLADAKAARRVDSTELSTLKAANQQKVCLDEQWTARQRGIAVRRLRVAVVHVSTELAARHLDPERNELPMFDFAFSGLEGFDPTLFDDDDIVVQRTHSLARAINMLNIALNRMRSFDLLPRTNPQEAWRMMKQHYESVRRSASEEAAALLRHLDDRYRLASGDGVSAR